MILKRMSAAVFLPAFLCVSCTTPDPKLRPEEEVSCASKRFNSLTLNQARPPLAIIRTREGNCYTNNVLSTSPAGVTLDLSSIYLPDNYSKLFIWNELSELPQWLFDVQRTNALSVLSVCRADIAQRREKEALEGMSIITFNRMYYEAAEYAAITSEYRIFIGALMRERLMYAASNSVVLLRGDDLENAIRMRAYIARNSSYLSTEEIANINSEWENQYSAREKRIEERWQAEEAERKRKEMAEEAERKRKEMAQDAERKRKEMAEEAEKERIRLAEEAFRREQIAKGLILFEGRWISKKEKTEIEEARKRLQREMQFIETADNYVNSKSYTFAKYKVEKVGDKYLVCRLREKLDSLPVSITLQTSNLKDIKPYSDQIFLLYGANLRTTAEGDEYAQALYWSGIENYIPADKSTTNKVNTYSTEKESAIKAIRDKFGLYDR